MIVNFLREPRPGSTKNDRSVRERLSEESTIVHRRARARLSKEVDDHFGSPDGGRNDRTRRCRTVDACFYLERRSRTDRQLRARGRRANVPPRRVRSIRRALALTVPRARLYVTVVIFIRCWRRDRRSESTFDRGDDERAVAEEFSRNKPKIDRRKVDVRPNS